MLPPDVVQRVVNDFLAKTACPFCVNWLRRDDTRTMLALGNPDALLGELETIHELVCYGLLTERRYANAEAW